MAHHFIITRFSILDKNTRSFKLTRETRKKNIKSELFNKDRLNFKFAVFDKITYPSIKNQTDQNYTWLIYTSKYLPENYKDKLEKYREKNIIIIYVENFDEMSNDINLRLEKVPNFITSRLDDDDGLNPHFLDTLNKYNIPGTVVSLPNGVGFKYKNGKITFSKRPTFEKNVSAGLSAINFNIFEAGSHTKVHEKYIVFYDMLNNAYLQCASEFCDTARTFK
jgi:hypothetical protein